MTQARDMDWSAIAATPLARIRAVRDYAHRVFDDETRAATWLGRANPRVGGGLCAVGAACQEGDGFREAMAELARIERRMWGEAPAPGAARRRNPDFGPGVGA